LRRQPTRFLNVSHYRTFWAKIILAAAFSVTAFAVGRADRDLGVVAPADRRGCASSHANHFVRSAGSGDTVLILTSGHVGASGKA
jgi:hypothetical protein